ncbi:phenylacetic acid degradation protein PaaY [Aminobacter sp. MDW-2]|uniref:gamma carbonic anhydrase family protein n=1 Tax=Aminobacter sp. MDW-2 TaxID=2666139 RepID=UPI0012AF2193|nr:phenylacetic acid degradation protein PaaY [Aminobacter sp. MDW-2]MRX37306.1 phenylacetic acid degradation protein PaaY [Aminobacter sp. MDW-2]QNH32668.1 phenylacetic acid degradation protein PaaY [Aminobacter sp. MDW-2]
MPCYAFEGIVPVVDPTAYLHPTAMLIGDVTIGPRCYIGPGASLRGDFGRITVIGDASVQDNCTLHTGSGSDCIVGRGATVGHGAILHGCTVGENALIGMNAVVLDGAVIGDDSLVAALSLVKNEVVTPQRSLIAGNPAKVIKEMPEAAIIWRNNGDGEYQRLADRSLADLVECEPLRVAEPGRKRNTGKARAVRLSTKTK